MINFDELPFLTLDVADKYRTYFNLSETELADACFNSRIAWQPGYQYRWFMSHDLFCTVTEGGLFAEPHFYLPLGEITIDNLQPCIDEIGEMFAAKGWPLRGMFIDDHFRDTFDKLEGYTIEWYNNQDYSDYLYDAQKLRDLSGKKYRQKRNHVNRFMRDYYDTHYRRLTADDQAAALELVSTWCQERDVDCADITESDMIPIRTLFENYDDLKVRGGGIFYGEELIAFALGSLVHEDYAVIHFEKAHPDYEGLYAAINQFVMQEEFAEARLVNREEDMGIEGMRIAKESYHPIRKLRKYEVLIQPKT